jgi:hypothetical protein
MFGGCQCCCIYEDAKIGGPSISMPYLAIMFSGYARPKKTVSTDQHLKSLICGRARKSLDELASGSCLIGCGGGSALTRLRSAGVMPN